MAGHGFVPTKDTHARVRTLLQAANHGDAAVQYFRLFGASMQNPLKWLEFFAQDYTRKKEFSLIPEVCGCCLACAVFVF